MSEEKGLKCPECGNQMINTHPGAPDPWDAIRAECKSCGHVRTPEGVLEYAANLKAALKAKAKKHK